MDSKLDGLKELYRDMYELDELSRQRYSLDYGVYNRAYTVRELSEDVRLEKEIDERRRKYEEKRKRFSSTFTRIEEIINLEREVNQEEQENKNKGIYDNSKYCMMRMIIGEIRTDFEQSKKQSTIDAKNVDIGNR